MTALLHRPFVVLFLGGIICTLFFSNHQFTFSPVDSGGSRRMDVEIGSSSKLSTPPDAPTSKADGSSY